MPASRPCSLIGVFAVVVSAAIAQQDAARVEIQPAGTLQVRVIERANGQPVARAMVDVLEFTGDVELDPRFEHEDEEPRIARFGRSYRSNDDGRLSIPWTGAPLMLCVRSGDLAGVVGVPSGEIFGPVLIEVERNARQLVAVEVVDGAGERRSGIEVAIAEELASSSSGPELTYPRTRAHGTTGPDGSALLEIGASLSRRSRARRPGPSYATLAFPHHPRVALAIGDAPPDRPLRLVLPATGGLVVEAIGPDGKPLRDPSWLTISARPNDVSAGVATWPVFERRVPIVSGRAVLVQVGLGLRFQISAVFGHFGIRSAPDLAGPTRANQDTTLRFEIAHGLAVATARILDPAGEPLRGARIEARLSVEQVPPRVLSEHTVETDANGRCWVALGQEELARHEPRVLVLRAPARDAQVRFDLSRGIALGVLELGDARLAPTPPRSAPLVAGGKVVDERGQPIAEATVMLLRASERRQDGEELRWSHELTPALTSVDGAFEFRGSVEPGELALSVRKPGFLRIDATKIGFGATDTVLVLARAAALEGSLLLEPNLVTRPFQVALRRTGEASASPQKWTTLRNGSFVVRDVAPGPVDLLVYLLGAKSPAHVVKGIELVAGETARGPRLEQIDLRGRFRKLDFVVIGCDGKPADGGQVDVFEAGQAQSSADFAFPNDHVTLVIETGPIDLLVCTNSCRPTWVRSVGEITQLVMKPFMPIWLRLAAPLLLASPRARLSPILKFEGTRLAGGYAKSEVCFDESGEILLRVGDPGRYTVTYEISIEKAPGLAPSTVISLDRPHVIEVLEADEEQVFQVDVPARAVEDAIASLR